MANTLTIATFNVENLFTRFKFKGRRVKNPPGSKKKTRFVRYTPKQLAKAVEDGFIIDRNVFKRYLRPSRTLTAKALKGVNADVVGLQEVENLDILKLFNTRYLKGASKFKYQYLIDGNDNRFIDVALLSKLEVDFLRTHQFRKKGEIQSLQPRLPGGPRESWGQDSPLLRQPLHVHDEGTLQKPATPPRSVK